MQNNFADRRAFVVNECPSVQLSNFDFQNRYGDGEDKFIQSLHWMNVGTKPIAAFEIVILKYDPFNRRLIGSRWNVDGKNSADWTPLGPGESSGDGSISYGTEDVFTEIAYVRQVRFADGTVWAANDVHLAADLAKLNTGIAELGDLKPDPSPAGKPGQK